MKWVAMRVNDEIVRSNVFVVEAYGPFDSEGDARRYANSRWTFDDGHAWSIIEVRPPKDIGS